MEPQRLQAGPPSAQSLRGGSGRQPVASPAQAQSCTPALPGPRRTAPGRGDPSIIRDLGAPVPTVPGTGSGWQGGRGGHQRKQGAQGQGRDGRLPCRPFQHQQSACLAEAPGDEASVLAHSQGQGAWERPRGGGRGGQLSTSFPLCSQMPAPTVRGCPSLHHGPRSACDGHPLNPRPPTPPWEGPEVSPGSRAALRCSPGDTLPRPRGLHHNCLAGG